MRDLSVTNPDPSLRSSDALEAEITTLAAHLNAGTFRFLTLIADFDQRQGWGGWGIRSCAHWLNWKCGIGLNAAREQLRVAHALHDLPHVSEAMREGELSYTKVRALTRVATPENEQCLLAIARNGTASHLETLVRHYRRTRRVEELAQAAARYENRALRYFWDEDGSLVIEARLPPEQGALVLQALRAADEALRPPPAAAPKARAATDLVDPAERQHAPASAIAMPVDPTPVNNTTPGLTAPASSGGASSDNLPALAKHDEPACALAVSSGRGPKRFVGLDPEQQEALERLEVALAQRDPADIEPADGDGTFDASAAAGVSLPRSGGERAPARLRVSAVTSSGPSDWAQRQADAFCLMAETLLTSGPGALKGGDRHLVHVRVDLEALCDQDGVGDSSIDGGPAIPPETVRRLCCDGGLVTWLSDASGNTLDVGRKTRVVPTALRRLLEHRDGGCRFPGCEQRRFVDAHHIEHWADGGGTDAHNLILLCRYHHRTLHEGGFRVSGDAERVAFVDPQGRALPVGASLPRLPHGDELRVQHAGLGLELDARTVIPGWGGESADYNWMLMVLEQYDRGAPPGASVQPS